ncbi:MAG: 4-alpha-glucanotransferase [Bacillota bacterium]
MLSHKSCGVLLHPTSLPSRYGIGDMGREAYDFIDFLKDTKQTLWQILPLGPVGFGESPYQSLSAFAGNPLLISIDLLIEDGFLDSTDIKTGTYSNDSRVNFEKAKKIKGDLFKKAFKRFVIQPKTTEYYSFIENNSIWLDNYCLFTALKEYYQGLPWNCWDKDIATRQEHALKHYTVLLYESVEYAKFLQYMFYSQWKALKKYANSLGVLIIGDLPIFVSHDSSDVWANRELFDLDSMGNPRKVAGVPPDYFSETGQLWGNPLYKWNQMKLDEYKWWRERILNLFKLVDIIRIDHFRGFEAYWEIPAQAKTAVEGKWVKGPAEDFFCKIENYLGKLPIIAENLGFITSSVERLRKKHGFPGMKILQFAFEGGLKEISSALLEKNTVFYSGTHDNDTLLGWFKSCTKDKPHVIALAEELYDINISMSDTEICWSFIEIAFQSKANMVIIPLQDFLCLDSNARMNFPGTMEGNWRWRLSNMETIKEYAPKLSDLTEKYKRNLVDVKI